MIIDKNGFYKLDEIDDNIINISSGVIACFYDEGNSDKKIILGSNSNVEFFGFLSENNSHNIEFILENDFSNLKVKYLLLSKDNNKLKARIYSKISSSNSNCDVKILSLVGENGDIDLDGIVEIDSGFKKIKGHLVEENLFLGNIGKIKGIPTLLVRSDDVEASHACIIEKISDDKLFYLRSRGVGRDNALNMILESKVNSIFSCLSMLDKDFYEKLINDVIIKINNK